MKKYSNALYRERENRIFDAIQLKVPDRVPIHVTGHFFPAKYYGFTCKDAMYDKKKTQEATLRFLQEFQPDFGENPFRSLFMGSYLESIGYKCLAWPGHGLSDLS